MTAPVAALCGCPAGGVARYECENARVDAFFFGDSPALAEKLAALVRSGRKMATAGVPVQFTAAGVPLPVAGGGRLDASTPIVCRRFRLVHGGDAAPGP